MTYFFTKELVSAVQLTDEITSAGLPAISAIDINDITLAIAFISELDAGQQSTLNDVVTAHVVVPGYVPLATQQAVSTLISYLNSPSPTVANTARSAVVATIAPNLPPNILATINAKIVTALGG